MSTEFRIKLIEESEGFPTPPPVPPPDRGSFDFATPTPTRPASPSAMPDWYPEYRSLRNAKDAGQTLSAGLEKRLGQLEEALQKEAAMPVAPEPAAPAPESPPPAPAPAPPEPELRPNPDLDAQIGLGNQAAAAVGTPSAFDFSPAKPEAAPPLFNEGGIFTGFSPPTPEEPTLPPGVKPFDFSPEPLFRAVPILDEIDKRIVEVLDKFRAGLLSADEAAQRLEGTVSSGKATDKFRAAYGPDADPKKIVGDLLKTVGEQAGRPGVTPPVGPGLLDQLGPIMGMFPGGTQFARMGRAIGLEDLLGGKSFDPAKGIADAAGKFKGLFSGGAAGAAGGAGEAAGAAGAAGGAAEAAGLAGLAPLIAPLTAAYIGLEYVAEGMAKRFGQIGSVVRGFGDVVADVAGNNVMGAFATASEGAAKVLEQVPIAGQVWASEVRLMTGSVEAANKVLGAFIQRGRELSAYDPNLAAATANADVRKQLADIREANYAGGNMGRLIDAQSRSSESIQTITTIVKDKIADQLAALLERLEVFLRVTERQVVVLDRIHMTHQTGVEKMKEWTGIDKVIRYATKWLEDHKLLPKEQTAFLENLIAEAIAAEPGIREPNGGDAVDEAARRRLGQPIMR